MTTKEGGSRSERQFSSTCNERIDHRCKHGTSRCGGMSMTSVGLLVISCLLAKAGYLNGSTVVYGSEGDSTSCLVNPLEVDDGSSSAVALPGDNSKNDSPEDAGTSSTVTATGQRVAGHLLAVLLLASVAAAIVEVIRARMSQCKSPPKTGDASAATSEAHHSSASGHGATGRISRRGTLHEKSQSQDSHFSRARSSSAGVSNQHVGAAAVAAVATARAQKVLRTRLLGGRPVTGGGRMGGTPPLIRRSSFPVMARTGSITGRDSNSGSPGLGTTSRKPSISDLADEDMGDYQKRRIRIIRRF